MLELEELKPSDTNKIIHWAISDILTHRSVDLDYYSPVVCVGCDTVLSLETDYEGCEDCHEDTDYDYPEVERQWEWVLDYKRRDHWFDDLKTEITHNGFTKPLTAIYEYGKLRFGDGHHRLAIAIDLGLETVPVKVYDSWHSARADDSGEWGQDYIEDFINELENTEI
jgi:hypothetical protein